MGLGSLVEQIDVVLVGAEAVMENGAVVNATGTFLLALAAKAAGKPLYVAVERYKFIRLYPLNQNDLRGKAHAFRLGETRNSISSVFIMRSSSHLGLQS